MLHYPQVYPITLLERDLLLMLIGLHRIQLLSLAKPKLNTLNCLYEGQFLSVGLWQLASRPVNKDWNDRPIAA